MDKSGSNLSKKSKQSKELGVNNSLASKPGNSKLRDQSKKQASRISEEEYSANDSIQFEDELRDNFSEEEVNVKRDSSGSELSDYDDDASHQNVSASNANANNKMMLKNNFGDTEKGFLSSNSSLTKTRLTTFKRVKKRELTIKAIITNTTVSCPNLCTLTRYLHSRAYRHRRHDCRRRLPLSAVRTDHPDSY